jgi:hypothetical protein
MTTDIFIATYAKDKLYFDWCMKSIRKFASGFNAVVLIVPETDAAQFTEYGARIKTYVRDSNPAKGQIHAQAMKCMADLHCESDFILHTDSDCVFTEPVTPEDYFMGRKPVMLIRPFNSLPPSNPWKEPTERALGWPVNFETMARHPQVNPRRIYHDMRERIENLHGKPFVDYVLSQKHDFPWGFSEHCCIGAYALHDAYWKNEYHWVDLTKSARPKDKLYQAWSHSPPEVEQDMPHGGRDTPMEVYKRIGL